MKKQIPILLIFLLPVWKTGAQNLVVNGSFEDYHSPPIGNQILLEDFVQNWSSYITTPDYYSTILWSPAGVLSYCNTLPRTGSGMIGGYQLGYFPSLGYNREYIQGELTSVLKPNTLYYAEVYVKPWRKSPVISWGLRDIGIALTDKHYTTLASVPAFMIPEVPEVVYQAGPITDLGDWTKISGCFVAQGGETKVILGTFSIDSDVDKQLLPGASGGDMAYYFFDDLFVTEIGAISITADTTICQGKTITLNAFYANASSYHWNTGASTASIQVAAAGTYTVQVTTAEGCMITTATTVKVRNCDPVEPPLPSAPGIVPCPAIQLPDAFTPNNDGKNDLFRIINRKDIYLTELSIYNRWGEKVFYTRDIEQGWDGSYKGVPAEIGVYGYQLLYRDCYNGDNLSRKGTLTLIR